MMTLTKRMISHDYEMQYQAKQKHLARVRAQFFNPITNKLTVLVVPSFGHSLSSNLHDLYIQKHILHWQRCHIVYSECSEHNLQKQILIVLYN